MLQFGLLVILFRLVKDRYSCQLSHIELHTVLKQTITVHVQMLGHAEACIAINPLFHINPLHLKTAMLAYYSKFCLAAMEHMRILV